MWEVGSGVDAGGVRARLSTPESYWESESKEEGADRVVRWNGVAEGAVFCKVQGWSVSVSMSVSMCISVNTPSSTSASTSASASTSTSSYRSSSMSGDSRPSLAILGGSSWEVGVFGEGN